MKYRVATLLPAALAAACIGGASVFALRPRAAAPTGQQQQQARPGQSDADKTLAAAQGARDYSKFTHTSAVHARLPCLLCHRRDTASPRLSRPGGSGHMPCAGCHAQQFTDSSSPLCVICHTEPRAASPPVKPMPPLRTFALRFDHAAHARAAVDCSRCHRPAGRNLVALSIPAGPTAHATCFACHGPRARARGRDISSCSTCHRPGRPTRTPVWSRAYAAAFSHAEHARKGVACDACHTVRAGAPRARQVTSPFPSNHHAPAGVRSCATCHDDRRAFGGDDFKDCKRCHRGNAWYF